MGLSRRAQKNMLHKCEEIGLLNPIKTVTKRTDEKRQFLLSLAKDLRALGFSANIKSQNETIRFKANLSGHNLAGIDNYMRIARNAQLRSEIPFIKRMESSGISNLFINGSDINLDRISPRIQLCHGTKDFEIYRYGRFLQSVPNANRIGRRIAALVYDDGQQTPSLMGVIGLASSMYTLGCRDRYLNWIGQKGKKLKDTGLRHLMDLAVCTAFPPYSYLLGGKLMALLAMTDTFRMEYRRKYSEPLLGLITTCASGIHCPIFNRIMIRKGGLYRHIGETSGYTTSFFSTQTMRTARQLTKDMNIGADQLSSKPLRVIKQAIRKCDLPYISLVRIGNPKAVYFAFLSEQALKSLQSGGTLAKDRLSAKDAIHYWTTCIMTKKLYNEETRERIYSFKRESISLR
jgi:hypothetical protein